MLTFEIVVDDEKAKFVRDKVTELLEMLDDHIDWYDDWTEEHN